VGRHFEEETFVCGWSDVVIVLNEMKMMKEIVRETMVIQEFL
jgi:hypothetical protein